MSNVNTREFTVRICTIFLGLMPFLINLLVNFMAGTVTYYSVFHVNDLMYFVITVCVTTLLNGFVDRGSAVFRILTTIALVVMLILAALFLGISSHYIAEPIASGPYEPQMRRLIAGSLIVSGFALLFTLLVEFRLCFYRKPPDSE
jgi:hypothetical protein